jgi:glycosyltransferase involved in cell wall biosynthesis
VIVASRLFAPEVAAAAFRLEALADALVRTGADVRVLTAALPRGIAPTAPKTGIRVDRAPVLRNRNGYVRGYLQYLSFDVPLAIRLLVRSADLVVAEPPPTTGAVVAVTSWLRRRPFAYYAADVWSDAVAATGAPGTVVRLMRAVERFAMRRAAVVLAVSEDVARRVRELSGRDADVVGNGIDTEVFTDRGTDRAAEGPYFVYAGTMSEWQGPDVFLRAADRLADDDVRVHFFGQGAHEPTLRELAGSLRDGLAVFHGVVTPVETATWLRSAAAALVSIVPGQGYDLARPTKIFAAAACGTPVVFAGAGAGAELVEGNSLGWSVPYDDLAVHDALAAALAAAGDGSSRRRRAARARWAAGHASLEAAGSRAAALVLAASEAARSGR